MSDNDDDKEGEEEQKVTEGLEALPPSFPWLLLNISTHTKTVETAFQLVGLFLLGDRSAS